VAYDANAYNQELAEIRSNPDLGATDEERLAKLQMARGLVTGLNFAAVACLLSVSFLPVPWRPVCAWALLLLPWIAVVALHNCPVIRFFAASKRRRSAYPDLSAPIILSPVGLVVANSQLGHLVLLKPALAAAVLPGVLVALAFVGLVPFIRQNRWLWLAFLIYGCIYSAAALVYVDKALDRSPAEHHWSLVVGKHLSAGKSRTCYFELEPWLGHVARAEVSVPRRLYNSKDLGDSVDVISHSGAIGLPWFTVR
jgi:hypothetical protein